MVPSAAKHPIEHEMPNIPINTISKLESSKLFLNFSALLAKISPKGSKGKSDPAGGKSQSKKNSNIYHIEN